MKDRLTFAFDSMRYILFYWLLVDQKEELVSGLEMLYFTGRH